MSTMFKVAQRLSHSTSRRSTSLTQHLQSQQHYHTTRRPSGLLTTHHPIGSNPDNLPTDVLEKLQPKRGTLELADGSQFHGFTFGKRVSHAGEVVFNTGMVGYPESLSDPSYRGQIVTMTFPLQGNYGVPPLKKDHWGLYERFESPEVHINGLLVGDYAWHPSHWASIKSLHAWLEEFGVPGLYGVDTRAITKKIRDKKSPILLGRITIDDRVLPFYNPNDFNIIADVSTPDLKTYGDEDADVHILALDLGMKESIIRQMTKRGAKVTRAPWNYPIWKHLDEYDGLFLSNGPGDPIQPMDAQNNLGEVLKLTDTLKPVFGICMGHQLMARAAGASTYKMKFGHRGHNQPCVDLTTGRCHITSQNHGYVVDYPNSGSAYHSQWDPLFMNANDHTNEGMIHKNKPIFSSQFHPEGNGGPEDTTYLFDRFLAEVRRHKMNPYRIYNQTYAKQQANLGKQDQSKLSIAKSQEKTPADVAKAGSLPVKNHAIGSQLNSGTPLSHFVTNGSPPPVPAVTHTVTPVSQVEKPQLPKKVLVLGSGGLQIGQAGEFDYSGSQAIKALKEEGIQCILINPNIANVQTKKGLADQVYFSPVTVEFVESIIQKEKPDGIFLQFGGQTALNVGVELEQLGILSKYNVKVYGTSVTTIIATEDRDIFKQKLKEIGEPVATSLAASTMEAALKAANTVGYPVIARAAFALGGLGSGFAHNDAELQELCEQSFRVSPQVLIERSMLGWKEVEYEVVRDVADNCVTVCNMENFDPLGIHTGDSIVVAPSQTLDDKEYQMLRHSAIAIVRHLGIVGECNVQYALSANSRDYCVIEVNPRLSRSSALASKATGYPLAFVAAKLAMGYKMTDIKNKITQSTSTNFEPALDYVVVKMPRWDLGKFYNANRSLGSAMKSVGEVMAIGRTFEETFQKALRMVDNSSQGFDVLNAAKEGLVHSQPDSKIDDYLINPTDLRIHAIAQAFARGYSIERIHKLTNIDPWYLHKLQDIHMLGLKFQQLTSVNDIGYALMKEAKRRGFSDQQISNHININTKAQNLPKVSQLEVRKYRKSHNILPVVKQIDTLAAEYPAQTNYLYTTYNAAEHDVRFEDQAVAVLGSGCYSIGNSVEFDYSCVSAIQTLRQRGKQTIMINYNPETVSTDYDESDRLYFDELSFERVMDILDLEQPEGVVVSVGGQIANNLALPLYKEGVPIMGTSPLDIDKAEDRNKFSALMDEIGVKQPKWSELTTMEDAYRFCDEVGYPVLVRPSYVLSGAAMKTVWNKSNLEQFLANAKEISREHPVVISQFMMGAKECDLDAVASKGEVVGSAICEHVENAGVHSGDATLMFPAQTLRPEQLAEIETAGKKIAKALNISGPFNCQFIVTDTGCYVIETNVRASRSLPFVSKAADIDFIAKATNIWLGHEEKPVKTNLDFIAVKVPQFSFRRLPGADPITGVEMASTGEVASYGRTVEEAFLKALMSSNIKLPGKEVMLLSDDKQCEEFVPSAAQLAAMGYKLHTTPNCSEILKKHGVPHINHSYEETKKIFSTKQVSYVFVFPAADRYSNAEYEAVQYDLRRAAVNFALPICNNCNVGKLLVRSLALCESMTNHSAEDYLKLGESRGESVKIVDLPQTVEAPIEPHSMENYRAGNKAVHATGSI